MADLLDSFTLTKARKVHTCSASLGPFPSCKTGGVIVPGEMYYRTNVPYWQVAKIHREEGDDYTIYVKLCSPCFDHLRLEFNAENN